MIRSSPKTLLHHYYNQPYFERVLVCAFSQKGTWTERGPGLLEEVRGISHKTKPTVLKQGFYQCCPYQFSKENLYNL